MLQLITWTLEKIPLLVTCDKATLKQNNPVFIIIPAVLSPSQLWVLVHVCFPTEMTLQSSQIAQSLILLFLLLAPVREVKNL